MNTSPNRPSSSSYAALVVSMIDEREERMDGWLGALFQKYEGISTKMRRRIFPPAVVEGQTQGSPVS